MTTVYPLKEIVTNVKIRSPQGKSEKIHINAVFLRLALVHNIRHTGFPAQGVFPDGESIVITARAAF
ncbi:hypothetical protein [Mailhella massiliensis]|uniref:Uncharacterized protein n=1 Tax=Mailhella massiliensis TaxID=1903261 RepID=A0A921AUX1_9BACT|nr:hypothetical protein [Mailhella massiliensis]HJD96262.1 hypothetical protein [Mailhella massiliensis]